MLYSKTKLYRVWDSMVRRCHTESHRAYNSYGGRGIFVCNAWRYNSKTFIKWAIKSGYKLGLQLDRINNNKGYSPGNCRFTTRKINSRNKRNAIEFTAFGERKKFMEWLEDPRCVVGKQTLYTRVVEQDWDGTLAITSPPRHGLRMLRRKAI